MILIMGDTLFSMRLTRIEEIDESHVTLSEGITP